MYCTAYWIYVWAGWVAKIRADVYHCPQLSERSAKLFDCFFGVSSTVITSTGTIGGWASIASASNVLDQGGLIRQPFALYWHFGLVSFEHNYYHPLYAIAIVCSLSHLSSYPSRWSFSFTLGPLHWSSIFLTSREQRNIVQLYLYMRARFGLVWQLAKPPSYCSSGQSRTPWLRSHSNALEHSLVVFPTLRNKWDVLWEFEGPWVQCTQYILIGNS